jgi:glycosyltransferase involved in cell wall biosynthesis
MKILKILNSEDGGGVLTCEIQFIKELRSRNITVDAVVLGTGKSYHKYKAVCSNVITLPPLDVVYGGSVFSVLSAIVSAHRYGRKYARHAGAMLGEKYYDMIIFRRPTFIHLAGHLGRRLKCNVMWHHARVANRTFSSRYYNYCCRRYKITQVANSQFTQERLGSQCRFVVYPGFDENRVVSTRPLYRQQLQIDNGVPVYGIAARIMETKAQDIVVDAFVHSRAVKNGAHLLLAGRTQDAIFMQKVQARAGGLLSRQIHFLGEIEDLPAFYSSIDVLINSSKSTEAFGISIAEAMGAGLPVIAYYLGGPSETVRHNVTGWLVKEPTVESYKNALDISYERISEWPEMGNIGRRDAAGLTVKANVDKLINIIEEVIKVPS